MYYIKGFREDWQKVSYEEAVKFGENRLESVGLSIKHNKRLNEAKIRLINRHVKGINLKEFEIYE